MAMTTEELRLLHASLTGNLEVVQRLVVSLDHNQKQPSRVNVNCSHPASGMTPLCCAAHSGHLAVVRYLIESAGAQVDKPCVMGTPLLVACVVGHAAIVQYLVTQAGADLQAPGKHGITPTLAACNRGHVPCLEILVARGGDEILQRVDNHGLNAFTCAFMGDRFDVLRYLIQQRGFDVNGELKKCRNSTPLYFAVSMQNLAMVSFLLSVGANVDKAIQDGETALFPACRASVLPIIRILLEHGANIHAQNDDGATPLMAGIHSQNLEAVKLLLEHGANPNQEAAGGVTPLFLATNKGSLDVFRIVLEYGADLDLPKEGMVLIHLACKSGHTAIVQYLLETLGVLHNCFHQGERLWFPYMLSLAARQKHPKLVWYLVRRQMAARDMFRQSHFNQASTQHVNAQQQENFDVTAVRTG